MGRKGEGQAEAPGGGGQAEDPGEGVRLGPRERGPGWVPG